MNEYVEIIGDDHKMKKVKLENVLAKNISEVVCVCDYCKLVFKIRPYICACSSNVFLRNINTGYKKQGGIK